jgi:hypothetical protein
MLGSNGAFGQRDVCRAVWPVRVARQDRIGVCDFLDQAGIERISFQIFESFPVQIFVDDRRDFGRSSGKCNSPVIASRQVKIGIAFAIQIVQNFAIEAAEYSRPPVKSAGVFKIVQIGGSQSHPGIVADAGA